MDNKTTIRPILLIMLGMHGSTFTAEDTKPATGAAHTASAAGGGGVTKNAGATILDVVQRKIPVSTLQVFLSNKANARLATTRQKLYETMNGQIVHEWNHQFNLPTQRGFQLITFLQELEQPVELGTKLIESLFNPEFNGFKEIMLDNQVQLELFQKVKQFLESFTISDVLENPGSYNFQQPIQLLSRMINEFDEVQTMSCFSTNDYNDIELCSEQSSCIIINRISLRGDLQLHLFLVAGSDYLRIITHPRDNSTISIAYKGNTLKEILIDDKKVQAFIQSLRETVKDALKRIISKTARS